MGLYADDSELESEMIRTLLRWWRAKCAGDIPDRADFDPADLKRLLPNIFMADVEQDPFRIRYRLVGTRATEATGMNITGRYLDELMPANPHEPWMVYYRRAWEQRVPVFGCSEAPTISGGRFTYEFGLFPLRRGGREVAQFVAIEDYFDLTSTLTELKEWRDRRLAED
ncbi:MAG: PAS domain-containing protein [Kiloniellaceae bacterium]